MCFALYFVICPSPLPEYADLIICKRIGSSRIYHRGGGGGGHCSMHHDHCARLSTSIYAHIHRTTNHKSTYMHTHTQPSPQNEDILVIPEMEYCQSRHMTIFLGSIYVYKGLLMVGTTTTRLESLPRPLVLVRAYALPRV